MTACWLYHIPFMFWFLQIYDQVLPAAVRGRRPNLPSSGQKEKGFKIGYPLAWAPTPWLQRHCSPMEGVGPALIRCWNWLGRSETQITENLCAKKKRKKSHWMFSDKPEKIGFWTLAVCEHKVAKSCRQWFAVQQRVDRELSVRGALRRHICSELVI